MCLCMYACVCVCVCVCVCIMNTQSFVSPPHFVSALQCITLEVNMAPWVPHQRYVGDWRFDCRYSKGRPIYRKVTAQHYLFNSQGWVWMIGANPEHHSGWVTMKSGQHLPYLRHIYHTFYNATTRKRQRISPLLLNVTCAERSQF